MSSLNYWAAIHNSRIYGVGDSRTNAVNDAEVYSGRLCTVVVPCTAAAYHYLVANGADARVRCNGSSVCMDHEAPTLIELDVPWKSTEESETELKLLGLRKAVCDALIRCIDTLSAQGATPPELYQVEQLLAEVVCQERKLA